MKDYICKCGARNEVELEQKSTAIGLYCKRCRKWIKWVSQNEAEEIEFRFGRKVKGEKL